MFVKKFEAPSLEEALKMVKSEMGAEALVLSTQEKRSGKLFSRRLIEVTAAAEGKKASPKEISRAQLNSRDIDLEQVFPGRKRAGEVYNANLLKEKNTAQKAKSERYIDIDSDKMARTQTHVPPVKVENNRWESSFKNLGISAERSLELSKKMFSDFSKSDLVEPEFLSKAKSKVLSQGIRTLTPAEFFKKRAWVPVGIAGSGKTTLLVKLAILARDHEKSISLVSMDNRKFAGRSELAGYARLIRVPFFADISQAIPEKLKLIDSPAMTLNDESNTTLEKLCVERASFIVLDASSRLSELMRQVDKARSFCPEGIVFTKVDAVDEIGVIYDVLKATQLPLIGISASSSFKTKFKFLNPNDLAQLLIKE
jgi:flagellar biosynthesis protein FlhF